MSKINVQFAKRTAEQVAAKVKLDDPSVAQVKCELDFSKLTPEQILEWAARGVKIHVQAQIKSGAITVEKLEGKVFEVPEPGDRKRLSDEDKLRDLVGKLMGKKREEVTNEDIRLVTSRITG